MGKVRDYILLLIRFIHSKRIKQVIEGMLRDVKKSRHESCQVERVALLHQGM